MIEYFVMFVMFFVMLIVCCDFNEWVNYYVIFVIVEYDRFNYIYFRVYYIFNYRMIGDELKDDFMLRDVIFMYEVVYFIYLIYV